MEAEREAFYDAEIAPALLDLSKRCHEAGLSFLAAVEWEPGETGRTAWFQEHAGLPMQIANVALKAGNNVDSLFMWIERYAREHGHSSMYLYQLKVPMSPKADEPPQ